LHRSVPSLISHTKRFSYVQQDSSTTIALVPTNPFLFKARNQLINQLKQDNWQITNYGLIIIGNTTTTPTRHSLRQTTSQAIAKLTSRQYPSQPNVIANIKANTWPLLSHDTALIGIITNRNRELKTIIAPRLSDIPPFSISGPPLPNQEDFLSFSLPGATIQSVSTQLANDWNRLLHQRLGFINTKPPLVDFLGKVQTSSLAITDEQTSLAIIGDPSYLNSAWEHWLQDEEAYSRPQRKAFRLPDRTLGYELVKGDSQPVLAQPDSSGCRRPINETIKLWLCQNNQGLAVGTNRDTTLHALDSITTTAQQVSIGNHYLQQIELPLIQHLHALTYFSFGEYTIITASLRQ